MGMEISANEGRWLLKKKNDVLWVRDNVGVIVINPDEANYAIFAGLEADLWDLIVLNRSFTDILFLVVSCLGGSQAEARNHLDVIIRKWSDQGFVSLEAEVE